MALSRLNLRMPLPAWCVRDQDLCSRLFQSWVGSAGAAPWPGFLLDNHIREWTLAESYKVSILDAVHNLSV